MGTGHSVLFVGNLPPQMSEDEVHRALEAIVGPVLHFDLKTHPPPTLASKSFGFAFFGAWCLESRVRSNLSPYLSCFSDFRHD